MTEEQQEVLQYLRKMFFSGQVRFEGSSVQGEFEWHEWLDNFEKVNRNLEVWWKLVNQANDEFQNLPLNKALK